VSVNSYEAHIEGGVRRVWGQD